MTVYLPPEVCGALSIAERHLKAAGRRRRGWGWGERRQKHMAKVQKLVARAARLLRGKPFDLEQES